MGHARARVRALARSLHTACVECGEQRLCALDHAHIAGAAKRTNVTKCRGVAAVRSERAQCRTLCVVCHSRETFQQQFVGANPRSRRRSVRERRALAHDVLFNTYAGRCQFAGCAFTVTRADPAWRMAVMEWDHADGGATKTNDVTTLVRRGSAQALAAELRVCLPLCKAHHRVTTRARTAMGASVPFNVYAPGPRALAAAAATVADPAGWIDPW